MYIRPGIFRRLIRIVGSDGMVRADVEDDQHRFGVAIRHDGRQVTAIEGFPIRTPWTACVDAASVLDRLVGMKLSPHPLAAYRHLNGKLQCTHMLDMASFAIAHAARGTSRREYDAKVEIVTRTAPREPILRRDGEIILRWTIEGTMIRAPDNVAGQSLRTLLDWAETAFPEPDDFEAILVMRRAILISGARTVDLDRIETAAFLAPFKGACYAFQPGTAEHALRVRGNTRDFTNAPESMLADLAT